MDEWQYTPAEDLDQSTIARLRRVPREPDMLVYALRTVSIGLIRQWLRLYHRLTIAGREHLPSRGPFIIAANHSSHLDAACLAAALPLRVIHRVFPAAASDYFFVSLPRLALAAVVINALPFDRELRPRQSLRLCEHLLTTSAGGNILVLFPEGTRSVTGEMGEFQPGIGLVAAKTGVPVVPAYLAGAHRAWPKGCRFPRPGRVMLRFGEPRSYGDREVNKRNAIAIASDLRTAVSALANEGVDPS